VDPTNPEAMGRAMLECIRRSAGGYVLVRYGRRETSYGSFTEYRVNVRLPEQEGEIICASTRSPLLALERAIERLKGHRRGQ
jgi:hypothetical protein